MTFDWRATSATETADRHPPSTAARTASCTGSYSQRGGTMLCQIAGHAQAHPTKADETHADQCSPSVRHAEALLCRRRCRLPSHTPMAGSVTFRTDAIGGKVSVIAGTDSRGSGRLCMMQTAFTLAMPPRTTIAIAVDEGRTARIERTNHAGLQWKDYNRHGWRQRHRCGNSAPPASRLEQRWCPSIFGRSMPKRPSMRSAVAIACWRLALTCPTPVRSRPCSKAATKHFGPIDGLVNSAGIRGVGSVLDTTQ